MPRYKITEIHPDYKEFVKDSPSEYERNLINDLIGKVVVSIDHYEHDKDSPPLIEGGQSVEGYIGFPPWYGAEFEGGEMTCLVAVKAEILED